MWKFVTPPAIARQPQVVVLAFRRGPLAGPPPALPGGEVHAVPRAADPAWFDAWRGGALRAIAERDLPTLEALDACDHLHLLQCAPVAPADLGYLEAVWAAARELVARGAEVVLDAIAMRFLDELPPADAGFEAARELRVIYETAATRGDQPHALHTRGLRKFGAPDLIALCGDADAPLVGAAIGRLAAAVAGGEDLVLPRHPIAVAPGVTWYAVADEHGLAPLLQLANHARVVVDADGRDLVGVSAALRPPD